MKTVFAAALLCALTSPVAAGDYGDDPWSCFGAGRYQAMSEGRVCPQGQTGRASWYGGKRHHGKPMASGQIYDQESDSCAHRSLPFGTLIRVTRRDGRSVGCVVRDRGPFVAGRIVDLSRAGARQIGLLEAGVARVELNVEAR